MLRMSRGDTIIEVLLAFTVFSLISVGSMTVMNQGTHAAQRALEITLVRQQIDAQAEALRAAQQAFMKTGSPEWNKFAVKGAANNSSYVDKETCPVSGDMNHGANNVFIMNPKTAEAITSGEWYADSDASEYPYARVNNDGKSYGIWIERTYRPGTVSTPDSYDFDVKACWYGAGIDIPLQIETTVRLYEPRV